MLSHAKIAAALMGFAIIAFLSACTDRIYIFEGVQGPMAPTPLVEPEVLGYSQFDHGDTSRLAILITEDTSNWLALATGLKTIGIPFRMTKDIGTALEHDIVMVYPQITGTNISRKGLEDLRRYVDDGGTLIGTNILGGALSDVFGFRSISENKSRYRLDFQLGHPETAEFGEKGLARIQIGNPEDDRVNPGTNSYLGNKNPPLAVYENGEAAIIRNHYGKGKTYALGVDLGQILGKGYNRRQSGISEYYANAYQPILDAWLIFFENIYKKQSEPKVVLGTVPDGKSLSFMLSHDVDFSESMRNAIPYATHQKEEGISATFFIQTKYTLDYNDVMFFSEEAEEILGELENSGAEIASHSVAHSNAMWEFDVGDGTEFYPEYTPFVRNSERTTGATLLGEVRVSKFLLDHFSDNQKVESFRPGFLANPAQMPQVLKSAGYKYSSSTTANVSLTHLPFQLSYDRAFSAFSDVYEIPITIEDELNAPMINRLEESKEIARQIAKIDGSYVVLIHTDEVDSRLEFQKAIVDEVRPYAWMGSIREFGEWWAARDKVEVDLERQDNGNVKVVLNAAIPIDGLTLELNAPLQVERSSLALETIRATDNKLLLPLITGEHEIILKELLVD